MSDIVFAIFDMFFLASNKAFLEFDIYRKKFDFISKIFCNFKNFTYICSRTKNNIFMKTPTPSVGACIKQGNVPTEHTNPHK